MAKKWINLKPEFSEIPVPGDWKDYRKVMIKMKVVEENGELYPVILVDGLLKNGQWKHILHLRIDDPEKLAAILLSARLATHPIQDPMLWWTLVSEVGRKAIRYGRHAREALQPPRAPLPHASNPHLRMGKRRQV